MHVLDKSQIARMLRGKIPNFNAAASMVRSSMMDAFRDGTVTRATFVGGYANHTTTPFSDLDVVVCYQGELDDFVLHMRELTAEVLIDTGVVLECIPLSEQEIAKGEHTIDKMLYQRMVAAAANGGNIVGDPLAIDSVAKSAMQYFVRKKSLFVRAAIDWPSLTLEKRVEILSKALSAPKHLVAHAIVHCGGNISTGCDTLECLVGLTGELPDDMREYYSIVVEARRSYEESIRSLLTCDVPPNSSDIFSMVISGKSLDWQRVVCAAANLANCFVRYCG